VSAPPASDTRGLQRLKRVSWRSVLQVVLLVLAISVLVRTVTGVDLHELLDELRDAAWVVVVCASVVAQTPRLTQTLSTLGAAPRPLPL